MSKTEKNKESNRDKEALKAPSNKETPIDRLAGIVKIKENISKNFIKKENGYTYIAGSCP